MQVTIVPASPKTGLATIRALLSDPSQPALQVKGYYRDLNRVPAELTTNPRFQAVQGDVEDAATLDFSGSVAVFNITPPLYEEKEVVPHARLVSENVKATIAKAGSVKRLVLLSSVGAQYDQGTGEILSNNAAESILKDAAPEVVFVRCGFFMENWATSIETVREAGFMFTTITPVDMSLPMIAVKDIGSTCAAEVLAVGTPLPAVPHIFELHGPRTYNSLDAQKAFEAAAGKPVELRPVEKDGLAGFYAAVFPPMVAQAFTEMNTSYLEGGIIYNDPQPTEGEVKLGKTELVEAVKEMYGA
ncbi:hypothetical protein C8A05DRAFT_45271 [Staphylotrichum tortipilum]|uniref:NAD(P)-binding domain-containing protein n=1 Tax=Staphylotrichum tortipilum TaxID=2831512 RepID=A0AAN6MHL2_9PEZI|nr:hypothetical protein C8A05DRAFT_45271 [Staphylotrichum longicolle]